jgi:tricarballylate dehydrogenase
LIDAYRDAANRAGIELQVDSAVDAILHERGRVVGVGVRTPAGRQTIPSRAVVLASGGFESDADLRVKHLGPQWNLARVRGTPHNTGEALLAALAIGAQASGAWDGCHAIAWDAAAPAHGDRMISNRYSRQAYPYGLIVNRNGHRFVDEGADFRNYTYAKYGAAILRQPLGVAFQIFDAKSVAMLSPIDYATAGRSRYEAATIRDLADQASIDRDGLEETIRSFNAAVGLDPFNPSVLDGKRADGIDPPKSNWAQKIDSPPFVAFAVACGITFTFGGVRINPNAGVLDQANQPIEGLFAAGETVGGLFYHNYPGGTGLASGTVFGRRAGRAAAAHSHDRPERQSGQRGPMR